MIVNELMNPQDIPAAPLAMPPYKARHMIMVDASYNHTTNIAGISLVVRAIDPTKHMSPIITQRAEAHASVHPAEVELFAILRALELANQNGWRHVKIKSDCRERKRLKELHRDRAGQSTDGLSGAILRLAHTFDSVKFGYVSRRKNPTARRLARLAADNIKVRRQSDDRLALWEIGIEQEIARYEQDANIDKLDSVDGAAVGDARINDIPF